MNYKKVEIGSIGEDEASEKILMQIAKWHNLTPKLWIPNYIATAADLEETVKRIQNTKPEDLFLAIAEDQQEHMQGFIWAYRQEKPQDSVMILSLYVTEAHRGQGIATALKVLLEDWCRSEGIKTIQTTTHYTNHKMIALNQKLGYNPGMVHMTKTL